MGEAALRARYGLDPASLEVKLAAGWFVTAIRVVIREWALTGAEEDVYAVGSHAIGLLAGQLETMLRGVPPG